MCLLIVAACGGNDSSGGAAGTPASTTTPATSGSGATTATTPKAGSGATGAAGSTTAANGGSKAPTTGTTTGASTGSSGMSASAAGSTGKAGAGAAAGSGGAMMSAAGGSAAGMSGGTAGGSAGGSTGGGTLGGKLMYTGAFTMGMMPIPAHNKCPMDVIGGGMGDNKSPPLSWTGGPADTKSFAIVLFDTKYMMLHWVLWDIPPTVNMLTDGEITTGYNVMNPMGAHQAASMGTDPHGYFGPCSSGASAGMYEYRLYALNKDKLMLTESSTGAEAQMAVEAAKIDMVVWSGKPM